MIRLMVTTLAKGPLNLTLPWIDSVRNFPNSLSTICYANNKLIKLYNIFNVI
jgi:hypothetical protein